MRYVEIVVLFVLGRVFLMNKYVYFFFNMFLNVVRIEVKLVYVVIICDV